MTKPIPKVKMTEAIPEKDWPRMREYIMFIAKAVKYSKNLDFGELLKAIRLYAGQKNIRADATPEDVQLKIIELRKRGYSYKQIGDMVGLSQTRANFYGRYADAPRICASKQAGQ